MKMIGSTTVGQLLVTHTCGYVNLSLNRMCKMFMSVFDIYNTLQKVILRSELYLAHN